MDMQKKRSKITPVQDRGPGASTRSENSSAGSSTSKYLLEELEVTRVTPEGGVLTDEAYCEEATKEVDRRFDAKDMELDGKITTRGPNSSNDPAQMCEEDFSAYMSKLDMKERLDEIVARSNDVKTDAYGWMQITREWEFYGKQVDAELSEKALGGMHDGSFKCRMFMESLMRVGTELPEDCFRASGKGLRR